MKMVKILILPILFFASFAYSVIINLRNKIYDYKLIKSVKLSVPVISVGNISVGGTGKTQLVSLIGSILSQKKIKVGILSRGYGRSSKEDIFVLEDKQDIDWREVGDEPAMLYKKFKYPMGIGAKRELTGKSLISKTNIDCIILDDGFQYRKLYRDINIVSTNVNKLPWMDKLLPLGRLRENMKSLSRADAIVFMGGSEKEYQKAVENANELLKNKDFFRATVKLNHFYKYNSGEIIQSEKIKNKRIATFAGIANPERFIKTLGDCGIIPQQTVFFNDHFVYTREKIKSIVSKFKNSRIEYIITTQKDAMRLDGISGLLENLIIADVDLEISPRDDFVSWLNRNMNSN